MVSIHCISDTHGLYHRMSKLPQADILVHAGDWTNHSTSDDVEDFLTWFDSQPHRHKIYIPGNHETWVESNPEEFDEMRLRCAPDCHYLNDSGVIIEGLHIWGSPVQPRFLDWAFNRDRGPAIQKHWDLIPDDTQILVTHGPAMGHLDLITPEYAADRNTHQGCANLRTTIDGWLKSLRLHVFGHLHYQHGQQETVGGVTYVNAAVVDDRYVLRNRGQTIGVDSP